MKVGINGFGRIGRMFLRAYLERIGETDELRFVVSGINDLVDPQTNLQLLKYDSTQGRLRHKVDLRNDELVFEYGSIRLLANPRIEDIDWNALGVELVIESTGKFTSRSDAGKHLEAGAKLVVISAPSKDADKTFVYGINESEFNVAKDKIVSNASCTTNCFVPMVKVLNDNFKIKGGLMTTVHAMTNDQNLLDLAHKDLRRARAAACNIVPTATGAARATTLVMPEVGKILDGSALRVPVMAGSLTDFTAVLLEDVNVEDVNKAFLDASKGSLKRILEYCDEPIVSSDVIGSPKSCIYDSSLTQVMKLPGGEALVKVFGWYDNEWGYANRLVDLVDYLVRTLEISNG